MGVFQADSFHRERKPHRKHRFVWKWLNSAAPAVSIESSMIDIQHDSPVPIHEQITSQLMAHVAAGTLAAGARLADHRAFAQQLLTNPQATARAYAELEWE